MNPHNANRNSHAPVRKACMDCGESYSVARNAASQSHRCPTCRRDHDLERQRERNRRNSSFEPIRRKPRGHCLRCGKPANRYQHYCSTRCYVLEFSVRYNPLRIGVRE